MTTAAPSTARRLHIAIVHDHFTGPTGMGLVTESHAEWVLHAGWSLTVVGDNVPAWLAASARVIAAPRPKRLPSLPEHLTWCARAARAMRSVKADVVHVHSPLLASRADLLTSHHIAQLAYARGVREPARGPRGIMRTAQGEINRRLDDVMYRRLARTTAVSFVSEFLREEFSGRYGPPVGGWILPPPCPPWRPVCEDERAKARTRFGVRPGAIVAGYVGGNDLRKGCVHLAALDGSDDIELLGAGPGSERMRFNGRRGLGFVDVDELYAACDVVVAPALFDSAPVAVLQAVARGVPVVLTPTIGWAAAVSRHGAGVVWTRGESLPAAVRAAACCPRAACEQMTDELSPESQRDRLLDVYLRVAHDAAAS